MPFESKYTQEQKYEAALHYFVLGSNSSKRIQKKLGIPAQTIRGWTKTDWWQDMMREIRARHADKLDGTFTYLIDKLSKELIDRVEHGEEVLWSKEGVMLKKQLSARDITHALDRIVERRALLRGDPTSRSASQTSEQQLDNLQKKLEEAGRKKREEIQKQVDNSENVEKISSAG